MMAIALAMAQAAAEPAQTAMPMDDIVVTATGKPFRIEVADLHRGEVAFAKDHARYAPGSTLHFRLSPRGEGSLVGFQLSATDGHASVPVPLSAEGDIRLPDLPAGDWSLIGNRSGRAVRFWALILSPGSITTDRRLGDLRLQCRVVYAVFRSHIPFLVRGAFEMAGGCGGSHFGIYDSIGKPIEAARADDRGRTLPLKLGVKGTTYQVPLADKSLSDEARIRISLKGAPLEPGGRER